MTPMMETEKDRMEETLLENTVRERGYVPRRLPKKFQSSEGQIPAEGDWMIFYPDGTAKMVVEFKRRYCLHNQHETYIVSLAKWMRIKNLAETIGFGPGFIVVKYTDKTVAYQVNSGVVPRVEWGGRTDRGLDSDQEPMVHIPIVYGDDLETWVEGYLP